MRTLESVYAPHITRLITYKRSLGYKYVQGESVLSQFDAFCARRGEQEVGITTELAEAWAKKRPEESDPTRYARVHYLIQLASFLCDTGYPSFVPRPPAKYSSNFTPYIFTHDEIQRLFLAIDDLAANRGRKPWSCGPSAPYVMRLLYGTGARIGEACSVLGSDIDLIQGIVRLKDTKNAQERILPMTTSLTEQLERYATSHPLAISAQEPFFKRRDGQGCSPAAIYEWFRKALFQANIAHQGAGRGPRLHDLRHTFAVHSLAKMASEGHDLYWALPILSTYLGHQSLEATERYVRLTSEMFPAIIDAQEALRPHVFSEVM